MFLTPELPKGCPRFFTDHIVDLDKMVEQKSEQGMPLLMWVSVSRHGIGEYVAERLSGLSLDIAQPGFRRRRYHDRCPLLRLAEGSDVLIAVEVFLCPGSPPHTRGKEGVWKKPILQIGITPAHAGKR